MARAHSIGVDGSMMLMLMAYNTCQK